MGQDWADFQRHHGHQEDHFWMGNEEENKRRIRFMRIMACLSFLFLGGWKGIGRRKNNRQGDRMYNFHNGIYEVS